MFTYGWPNLFSCNLSPSVRLFPRRRLLSHVARRAEEEEEEETPSSSSSSSECSALGCQQAVSFAFLFRPGYFFSCGKRQAGETSTGAIKALVVAPPRPARREGEEDEPEELHFATLSISSPFFSGGKKGKIRVEKLRPGRLGRRLLFEPPYLNSRLGAYSSSSPPCSSCAGRHEKR